MLTTERKAKDDFIGGRDFSRVRRFDDEARKARIFAPNATFSIDVNKVEEQLKEKEKQSHLKDLLTKEEENQRALEKQSWDKEEEELRNQRRQARATLEDFWAKQDEEFKERWKHRPYELNSEKVGLLSATRYQFQDEEALREGEVVRRISDAWRRQIEDHNVRLYQEMEDRKKNDLQLDMERKSWEKSQEEIKKGLFDKSVNIANEYLRQHGEKALRDKKAHDEEHSYGISEEFFEQFQTRSR